MHTLQTDIPRTLVTISLFIIQFEEKKNQTKLHVHTVTVLHINLLQPSISSKIFREIILEGNKNMKKATVYMMYSSKRIEGPFPRKSKSLPANLLGKDLYTTCPCTTFPHH